MKTFVNLLTLGVIGALGYVAEPFLRNSLPGAAPQAPAAAQDPTRPPAASPAAPSIDLSTLAAHQLPTQVMLYSDAKVTDGSSGVTMKIEAGNRVKLLRLEGENAIISPGVGPFEGTVPVTGTDLLEQLAANPPATPIAPAPEPAAPITSAPEPAGVDPAPVPEPATPAVSESAPTAEPAARATSNASSVDVVKIMKASIRGEQIKEFKFEQVLNWKEDTDQIFDGETYKVGVATYKAETVFGVRDIQAKALIKDGKVHRWVYGKSGMEIK